MKINYKIDSKIRWAKLTKKIDRMIKADKIKLVIDALNYQSGEGLMNTVYMGGMATASLCHVIGRSYSNPTYPWKKSLTNCSEKALDRAIQVCMHTIEYMWANPRSKCHACGQIIPVPE